MVSLWLLLYMKRDVRESERFGGGGGGGERKRNRERPSKLHLLLSESKLMLRSERAYQIVTYFEFMGICVDSNDPIL